MFLRDLRVYHILNFDLVLHILSFIAWGQKHDVHKKHWVVNSIFLIGPNFSLCNSHHITIIHAQLHTQIMDVHGLQECIDSELFLLLVAHKPMGLPEGPVPIVEKHIFRELVDHSIDAMPICSPPQLLQDGLQI